MTPFIDSASVCLVIQKNKTTTTTGFGKLNSVLTRNQPLSSVDKWMYTIFFKVQTLLNNIPQHHIRSNYSVQNSHLKPFDTNAMNLS